MITTTAAPRDASLIQPVGVIAVVGLHALLAVAMYRYTPLATAHALAVAVVCLAVLLRGRIERIAMAAAYVAGAELLWRMCAAPVPYDLGRYLLIILLGGGALRYLKPRGRRLVVPLLYMLLLLPAAALTLNDFGFDEGRQLVAFALGGPTVLAASVLYFSSARASIESYGRVVWAAILGTTGLAAITTYATVTSGDVHFSTSSNFVTSGGYGPVQVSSALAFGAFLCLLLAFQERRPGLMLCEAALFVWLSIESVLTFSRGGFFTLVLSIATFLVVQLGHRRDRRRALSLALTLLAFASIVVFPRVDDLTGGFAEQRFTDTSTPRTDFVREDLQLFSDHPFAGVGAGAAQFNRVEGQASSHTEYTRLLAEHGLFGLVALALLVSMAVRALRRAPPDRRAATFGIVVWAGTQMAYANLRIGAIGFAFGLAALSVQSAERSGPSTNRAGSDGQRALPPRARVATPRRQRQQWDE